MGPNPDRPEFVIVSETQLALRCMFIDIYLEAEDFCAELIDLAEGFNGPALEGNVPWWFVKQQAPDSARAVARFCRQWGLTFEDKAAEAAIHWWATERRRAGGQCKPGNLVAGFHAGSTLPLDDIAPPPADRWDPTRESRDSAGGRIFAAWKKHLDAELDRIGQAYNDASPATVKRRPQRRNEAEKHLRWLFFWQARRKRYADIASKDRMTEASAVSKACRRLSAEIGLEMRR